MSTAFRRQEAERYPARAINHGYHAMAKDLKVIDQCVCWSTLSEELSEELLSGVVSGCCWLRRGLYGDRCDVCGAKILFG